MILVDTNILVDIASGDPNWKNWSVEALASAMESYGAVAINAVIYAEFSLGFSSPEERDAEVERFGAVFADLPREAAFRAGVAFRDYRRRGGARSSPPPDFFIGAHASVLKIPVLTRDATRYRTYFPEVDVLGPQ